MKSVRLHEIGGPLKCAEIWQTQGGNFVVLLFEGDYRPCDVQFASMEQGALILARKHCGLDDWPGASARVDTMHERP